MHSNTITKDAVLKCLVRYETERAETTNPQDSTKMCLYTDPDDTNRHCLAGQVIFDVTGKVVQPATIGPINGHWCSQHLTPMGVFVDPDAVLLLSRAQGLADTGGGYYGVKPWGDVVARLRVDGVIPPKPVTITKAAVASTLNEYRWSRNNQVNPKGSSMSGPICLYTDPADATSHCIAGQAIFDLSGWAPDSYCRESVRSIQWPDHITVEADALDLLFHAQVLADGAQRNPQEWGIVGAQLDAFGFFG